MTPAQAEALLTDEHIAHAALVLSALDFLQAEEFNLLEPELRKLGKFSESSILTAADKAIKGHGYMAVPGNGQGVKMNLSVLLNSLQVVGRQGQMEIALNACQEFESLNPQ